MCFVHVHAIGANVWLPNKHSLPSLVDIDSFQLLCEVSVLEENFILFQKPWWPRGNAVHTDLHSELHEINLANIW